MNIQSTKIICVGLNYIDHAKELGMKIPDEPILFMKPPSAIIGNNDNIVYPSGVGRLDYEAELAVVIGRRARSVPQDEALEYAAGFTALNDVTARDLQKKDGQWTRAKSFDTFCPVGPRVVSGVNPDNLKIELRLNGQVKQSSRTSQFIFPVERLISFISGVMTLEKGDIIATGTPSGVGPMQKGDVVEVEIEGIGVLKNHVV